MIKQLDLDLIHDEVHQTGFRMLNNACWSCGEIAVHEKMDLSPYLHRLYQGLLTIVSNEVIDLVNENAALALGWASAAPNRWPRVWANTPISF